MLGVVRGKRVGTGPQGFDRDASRAREYCIAKNAMHRAARPGPSAGKERPPQDDNAVCDDNALARLGRASYFFVWNWGLGYEAEG
jgi:hypothetical protein